MEPSINKQPAPAAGFMLAGLLLLAAGLVFGLTGALQYLIPGFLKQSLSFEKTRPLHVSSVVFWVIFGSMGAVLTYLQQHTGRKIFSPLMVQFQLLLFVLCTIAILITYCLGIFGGREYWEFNPVLALPILVGWILFLITFIKSVGSMRKQPVYVWMWLTGTVFFLFTFLESYLWIFPYFRNHVVNDMTIQWKSYGSMVGSWNMLIYGSSIFLMEKINEDKRYSFSRIAFVLYFTGLFNLLFNWGHHIYTLPTHHFIKHISYAVSMTELFIFGRMLFQWRSTVTGFRKHFHHIACRFLMGAEIWIFLTLLLAIIMSIPAINIYTHGTHITVAHTMGATIGINSFLLLAIAFDMLYRNGPPHNSNLKWIVRGYWMANISLFAFWISLLLAGIYKSRWQMSKVRIPFPEMMQQLSPFFSLFFISGLVMAIGLLMIIYHLIRNRYSSTINTV